MVREAMPDPPSRLSAAMPESAAPANLIARRFPGFARHTQHRALPRPGIADDNPKVAPVRDMRQRLGLLAGKGQPAIRRARQRGFSAPVIHLMAFALGHHRGGAMQALFGLDHAAAGEAVLPNIVLAEFDKIGRAAHRAHDLVELVDAIAVPVREHRHVAPCKGRLLLGDRVQGDVRVLDDARAVLAGDAPVILGAVGLDPGSLDALRRCADLGLRLKTDALRLKAAVVDPRVDVEFGKTLVDVIGPAFAPTFDQLGAVPLPHLLAEPVVVHAAHGQHDMGMGFRHSVFADIPMHVHIGDHALIDKFGLGKIAGQFDALALRHLTRKGELHLAAKLGVLPFLERLDIVPKLFAVVPFLRCVLRQHDLGMDDAALGGKVLIAAQPVVAQPRGRAVGGGSHHAAARRASDDLNGEMVDRHGDRPDTALKRTSERRISAPSK